MRNACFKILEPISKLLEEHGDTGELHKPEEVCGVILPANEQSALPLEPGEEAFHEPAPFVSREVEAVLCLQFPGRAMGRNHIHTILFEIVIEAIAIIGTVPNEMLRLGLQYIEFQTELDQRDFMMVSGMRTHREG